VTGGTYLESADDAKRFLKNGIKVYSDEILGLPVLELKEFAALRVAFAHYGVGIREHGGVVDENDYYIDGRQVSREEAWRYVESQIAH